MRFSKFVVLPAGSEIVDSVPCGDTPHGEQYVRVKYETGSVVAVSPITYNGDLVFLAFSESREALEEFATNAKRQTDGLDGFQAQSDTTARAIRRRWPVWRASGKVVVNSPILGLLERNLDHEVVRFSAESLPMPTTISGASPWTVDNMIITAVHSPSWDSTLAGALFFESAETGVSDDGAPETQP